MNKVDRRARDAIAKALEAQAAYGPPGELARLAALLEHIKPTLTETILTELHTAEVLRTE